MKRNEGRKGKATTVSDAALKRRRRERKGLCFLCLEHCLKFTERRNKRMVLSERARQKGTSWLLILHIIAKESGSSGQTESSLTGKHVTGDGFAQFSCSPGRAGSVSQCAGQTPLDRSILSGSSLSSLDWNCLHPPKLVPGFLTGFLQSKYKQLYIPTVLLFK